MEIFIYLLIGGIVMFSFYVRYKTFRTETYFKTLMLCLMVFCAYGIGFSLLKPHKVASIITNLGDSTPFIGALFAAAMYYVYYHVRRYYFSFSLFPTIGIIIGSYFGLIITSEIIINGYNVGATIFFFLALLTAAALQGIAGPLLAMVNITGIIMSVYEGAKFSTYFNTSTIFSFYELIGIEIYSLKWVLILISTGIGLYQTKDYFSEFIENHSADL